MTTYKELADRLEKFAANCCIPDSENTPPREAAAILRSLDAQPQQASKPLSDAWQEGYKAGVEDERISESNIGIAGYGAKVNPARQNPYGIKERG